MPSYTFECLGCGEEWEVVRPMSAAGEAVLCGCGRAMVRVYTVPQVRPDSFGYRKVMASLNSLDNDPGKHPAFEGRSEQKRYLEVHNRKFGTEYEY